MTTSWKEAFKRSPDLSKEEERALIERYKAGDAKAGQIMVEHHLGICLALAAKFRTYHNMSEDDLAAECVPSIYRALDRYDPDRNHNGFRYYAFQVCFSDLREYVMRNNWHMALPSSGAGAMLTMGLLGNVMDTTSADLEAVAEEKGVSKSCALSIFNVLATNGWSIDAPVQKDREDGSSWSDLTPDETDHFADVERGIEYQLIRKQVASLLQDRDRELVETMYFSGDEPMTLRDVGKALGFSTERARQIHDRAIKRLKKALFDLRPE